MVTNTINTTDHKDDRPYTPEKISQISSEEYNRILLDMFHSEVCRAVNTAEQILVSAAEMEILKKKEFLTEKEVSLLYSISPASLRTERCRGVGPSYIKDGRRVLYSKNELDLYFGKRAIKTRG